jgi:hypothetical protein
MSRDFAVALAARVLGILYRRLLIRTIRTMPNKARPSAVVPAVLSQRLRTALALYDSGVAMMRAQLRRQDRNATEEEIGRRLADWLRTRPGAPYGDAEGIGRAGANSR